MKQLLDIQDEINKRRSKALHLNSVRQVRLERGAVDDVNKVRQELAKPDGVIETTPGMEFEILKTGDMLAGQFNLLSEAKMEIDSIGANSATMGKDKTVQSGVALRQRAMTGQTELAPMFDMLKNLDIRIYKKVWNRIKQYWRAEMWLRVTDDENNLKFVGLNKPVTKGEAAMKAAQEAGMPPEQLAVLQQQIAADPAAGEVFETENEIVSMNVDIIMDEAPDTITQEVEDFQAMAEMVKSGFPIPPEAVIMASPLSNKDKIIKMMKEQPKLSPEQQKQMEALQAQMESIKGEAQKLAQENQALKQDRAAEDERLKLEQDKALAEHNLKIQQQNREAELSKSKAKAEYQLKEYIASLEAVANCDAAIMQVKNIAVQYQIKVQGILQADQAKRDATAEAHAESEQNNAEEAASNESKAQVAAITEQFMAALDQVVSKLTAAKTISLTGLQRNEAGVLTGASATVQ